MPSTDDTVFQGTVFQLLIVKVDLMLKQQWHGSPKNYQICNMLLRGLWCLFSANALMLLQSQLPISNALRMVSYGHLSYYFPACVIDDCNFIQATDGDVSFSTVFA